MEGERYIREPKKNAYSASGFVSVRSHFYIVSIITSRY